MQNIRPTHFFIVSTVRNVFRTLLSDCQALHGAFAQLGKVVWIITESDSTDDSIQILEIAKKRFQDFHFFSMGNLEELGLCRTERIAAARNRSLSYLYSNLNPLESDYVVLADLDGRNSKITKQAVESCWKLDKEWDVCTANQKGPYYDIWALRHPIWCPNDCFQDYYNLLTHGFRKQTAYDLAVKSRMLTIKSSQDPIQVESAYGGLALYKGNLLQKVFYKGLDDFGIEQCDHVSVNLSLSQQGSIILINPKMINGDTRSFRNTLIFQTVKSIVNTIFFRA